MVAPEDALTEVLAENVVGPAMSWRGSPCTARSRNGRGTGALFARIDNCGAKVLFEAATGRFF